MSETKLRDFQKRAIVSNLLNFRFNPEFKTMKLRRHGLAMMLYNQVFDSDVRIRMYTLPDGWLWESNVLYFTIGNKDESISFANCERWRMPYNCRDRSLAAFVATDKFVEDFAEWKNQLSDLKKLRNEASMKVHATLSKFTTTKRLIAEWPEVAQFVPNAPQPVRNLPAIPTEQLNAMLHLTAEKVES